MPSDPIKVHSDLIDIGTHHDAYVRVEHTAPYSMEDGSIVHDERKETDIAAAKQVYGVLKKEYPGYDWKVIADSRQGVVAFTLPLLLGYCYYRIPGHRCTDELVKDGGGKILDYFKLPRGEVNFDRLAEAQAMATVNKVPDL